MGYEMRQMLLLPVLREDVILTPKTPPSGQASPRFGLESPRTDSRKYARQVVMRFTISGERHVTSTKQKKRPKKDRRPSEDRVRDDFATWWHAREVCDTGVMALRAGIDWMRNALEERRPISRVSLA